MNEYEVDPPDRCPVCNKDLSSYSPAHRRKHIDRCRRTKPKYLYSNEPRGRPSKRTPIKTPCRMAIVIGISTILILLFDILLHLK